jgi:hypothetical protein
VAVAVANGRSCARRVLGRSTPAVWTIEDADRTASVVYGRLSACGVVASLALGVSESGILAGSMTKVDAEQAGRWTGGKMGRWAGERQLTIGET